MAWHLLLVALGGAIGSALRHLVGFASLRVLGPNFPWGTVAVNISGSFMMGLLAGLFALRGGTQEWRLFLLTGALGGFTTFSAFSLDAVTLWERGAASEAFAYVGGSVVVSIAALFAGLWLARALG